MASLAQNMAEHDAALVDAIGDTLSYGSSEVKGFFTRGLREIRLENGTSVGLHLSFACRYNDVNTLSENDTVAVEGQGEFRFLRFIPEGGDESGWVYMELGSVL